jgi:hypothetical protein
MMWAPGADDDAAASATNYSQALRCYERRTLARGTHTYGEALLDQISRFLDRSHQGGVLYMVPPTCDPPVDQFKPASCFDRNLIQAIAGPETL